jgi:tyrosyl-tRNA synthetase
LEPQVALTTPLISSWDRTKMSGSKGNYIALVEDPNEQFGKTMRLPDELLPEYYRLVLEADETPDDPLEAKLGLARFIVARAHGQEAARAAEEHFTRVVREGRLPGDLPEAALPPDDPVHLPALLTGALGVASTSEARRLIAQGGVRLDGAPVTDLDLPRERLAGAVIQVGKRRFARLTP